MKKTNERIYMGHLQTPEGEAYQSQKLKEMLERLEEDLEGRLPSKGKDAGGGGAFDNAISCVQESEKLGFIMGFKMAVSMMVECWRE